MGCCLSTTGKSDKNKKEDARETQRNIAVTTWVNKTKSEQDLKPLAIPVSLELTSMNSSYLGTGDPRRELTKLDLTTVPKNGLLSGKYLARVMRVYDGDTFTVAVCIDNTGYKAHQIRLYGCDAPEAKGTTKAAALQAKEELLRFIGADGAIGKRNGKEMNGWFQVNPIIITIEFMADVIGKVDKYGRDLARVWVDGDNIDLATHMINKGFAYAYHGGTKDQSQYEE